MRLSILSLFAAAALAAPFVFAQTVQPVEGPAPQGAAAAAARPAASVGTRRDIVSYVEELAGNTAAQLRAVQDENAELETRVIELERKIASLQETNQKLLNEIAAVKRQSAADADAREAQMKAILTKIDKLAATPAPAATVPAPVSAEADYEIYEVQKGATLSVIAKAYSEVFGKTVTVQDIKKANNLKSDTLQIGQKLKIPRK
ncbi:MAG: LysM peptidoglycan-binding domain-containing protein [Lentisphaeria bacterium]|jgi:LysM repeat protein|nr:LysM peptidoglycan-binding domain-containing protein [Lentisphaeria bacterium]